MIHPERRRENLKKIEEMDKRDAEPLQPDWKTWCMNKKVDMVEVIRCKDCEYGEKVNDVYLCGRQKTFGMACYPDWYCADGKVKEQEE